MTKAELIERYGIEWYEEYKARSNEHCKGRYQNDPEIRKCRNERTKTRNKERYQNDPTFRKYMNEYSKVRKKDLYHNNSEFREIHIERSKICHQARYVKDSRIDLIENYELAKADNFEGWDIHHKLELHPDGTVRFTRHSLIKLDLYYNRPSIELIWLRRSEHTRMHRKAR